MTRWLKVVNFLMFIVILLGIVSMMDRNKQEYLSEIYTLKAEIVALESNVKTASSKVEAAETRLLADSACVKDAVLQVDEAYTSMTTLFGAYRELCRRSKIYEDNIIQIYQIQIADQARLLRLEEYLTNQALKGKLDYFYTE